tara:strand:+ start:1432 stop:2439 length:1008 start_codon:yes stop_codon:yes gene_type:complete
LIIKMRIGIVGATGAVGKEILKILDNRKFPISELKLFASKKSLGKRITFKKNRYKLNLISKKNLGNLDIVFFAAGSKLSKIYAPICEKLGSYVIDNSSAFRLNKDIPLIVPEINSGAIKKTKRKIIANPNCTTIISLMGIKPIDNSNKIVRVVATSFQSVSGAGNSGIDELIHNTRFYKNEEKIRKNVFDKNITFNVIPKIGNFLDNGFTEEEMKLHNESRKILDNKDISFSATTVRVPVMRSHSISLNIEFKKSFNINKIKNEIKKFPGIDISDNIKKNQYPTPLDSTNKDNCIIGRIRKDFTKKNAISAWIVGDQIRKGAALNAVQIAELLVM